jgi:hypothetical protein
MRAKQPAQEVALPRCSTLHQLRVWAGFGGAPGMSSTEVGPLGPQSASASPCIVSALYRFRKKQRLAVHTPQAAASASSSAVVAS